MRFIKSVFIEKTPDETPKKRKQTEAEHQIKAPAARARK